MERSFSGIDIKSKIFESQTKVKEEMPPACSDKYAGSRQLGHAQDGRNGFGFGGTSIKRKFWRQNLVESKDKRADSVGFDYLFAFLFAFC
ncbi:hypothetical protein [Massilia niastensis]|uniref:hypothetical protein n=1 Tax=Massilia niastensis TaxID=544911 RepID=UPI0012EB9733|nr:hypothetical protein [Massilia niastensis]